MTITRIFITFAVRLNYHSLYLLHHYEEKI
nr:MAG TPA: hypothetical protein [Caudoviricetes sp.]